MKNCKRIKIISKNRINKEICESKVRLTDFYGKYIGIVNINEALKQAEKFGMDLVEINSNSKPTVCKIINYGKFIYEKKKNYKIKKKKQKKIKIKEIKFRPNTDKNDYKIKIKNLFKFLKNGNKVKVTIRFRGREIFHKKIGIEILHKIKNDLNEISLLEYFSKKIEGKQIIMILSPKKIIL
ncbi:MAG: translation initiation factor IF-3 [Enterobacterales bacterium]